MIRASAVLAVAASLALLVILAVRVRTGQIEGTVSEPSGGDERTPLYRPQPGTLWIVTIGNQPTRQEWDRMTAAGISTIGRTSVATGPGGDPPYENYWRLSEIPDDILRHARTGDQFRIRGKSLYLSLGDRLHGTSHLRYELSRGTDVREVGGAGNGRFVLVCVLVIGGPVIFWLLAAGIAVAARALYRRPWMRVDPPRKLP